MSFLLKAFGIGNLSEKSEGLTGRLSETAHNTYNQMPLNIETSADLHENMV